MFDQCNYTNHQNLSLDLTNFVSTIQNILFLLESLQNNVNVETFICYTSRLELILTLFIERAQFLKYVTK